MSKQLIYPRQPSHKPYDRNFAINIDAHDSVNIRLRDINKSLIESDMFYLRCAWQVALQAILEDCKNTVFSIVPEEISLLDDTPCLIEYIEEQEARLTEEGELNWLIDINGNVLQRSLPFTELCFSIIFQYARTSQVSTIFTDILKTYRHISINSEISSTSLVVNSNQRYTVFSVISW